MSNIIKGLRVIRNLTQEDVAKRIGISVRTYNHKESNPDKFTTGELRKLAIALEVKEEIFFKKELTVSVN